MAAIRGFRSRATAVWVCAHTNIQRNVCIRTLMHKRGFGKLGHAFTPGLICVCAFTFRHGRQKLACKNTHTHICMYVCTFMQLWLGLRCVAWKYNHTCAHITVYVCLPNVVKTKQMHMRARALRYR